ncbi:MAG: energy-coupled thiamine transporter ThiT [Clostridia bacterium]|nr:energy-coupled thiamine transporter ThiT [Clostridia bacterium]
MNFNLLSTVYLSDKLEPISLWLTIGFIGALLVTWLIAFLFDKQVSNKIAKHGLFALLFYSLVMGILLLVAEISKKYDLAYLEENWVNKEIINLVFIPVLITLCIGLLGGVALFITAKKKPQLTKIIGFVFGGLIGCAVIVSLILTYVFYSNNIVGDGYYTGDYGKLNSVALYLSAGLFVAVLVALCFIIGRKNKSPFNTKCISLAGICLAISFTLSYIKFEAAWLQGGSITLVSFLPICIFAYVYGMKKGLLVGFIYGILQAVQDPFIVHPAQFLLDYPIAFSTIALSGMLTDLNVLNDKQPLKFAISALLTGIFRYVAHTISGVFAFGAYAMDAEASSFFAFSAVYNTYVFIDIALVIVAGIALFSSKAFRKELDKLNAKFIEENK